MSEPQPPDRRNGPPGNPGNPGNPGGRADRGEPSPMLFVGAGFEFAAVVAVLTLLGWWLDGRWGTAPGLLITGMAVGLMGGIYKLYRTGKRFFR